MRSSATLRELEEFRVDAAHIEILASSKGPFGSQLFTLCARTLIHGSHGGGARTSTCQTACYNVQQQSRRECDACTPRRQPHWLAARGSYPSPTEGSCAPSRPLVCPSVPPQPRDACRSLRASARKEPPNHRKFDDRSARCKRACGNKWVPKGEDGDKGSESRQ